MRDDRKTKEEEVGKGEWQAEDLHRLNKIKRGERYYTDEALNSAQPSPATNKSVESIDVSSGHSIHMLKEAPTKYPQPQFTKV